MKQSLEEILGEVRNLSWDLHAKIIHQERDGYEDEEYKLDYFTGRTIFVEIQPEISEPDTEKRETARKRLQEIYDTSEWYSIRYRTGSVLRVPHLSNQLDKWIGDLACELIATQPATTSQPVLFGEGSHEDICYYSTKTKGTPDIKKRKKAIEDAGRLLHPPFYLSSLRKERLTAILKGVYKKDEEASLRKDAGRQLGYSDLRIWTHEHPKAFISLALASTGTIAGLAYALTEYFSR